MAEKTPFPALVKEKEDREWKNEDNKSELVSDLLLIYPHFNHFNVFLIKVPLHQQNQQAPNST